VIANVHGEQEKPTLRDTATALVAAREYEKATLSRLSYWAEQFGDRDLADISADDVDDAIVRLAERARLEPTRNGKTVPTGTFPNKVASQILQFNDDLRQFYLARAFS